LVTNSTDTFFSNSSFEEIVQDRFFLNHLIRPVYSHNLSIAVLAGQIFNFGPEQKFQNLILIILLSYTLSIG
jgi:hypothetical protein